MSNKKQKIKSLTQFEEIPIDSIKIDSSQEESSNDWTPLNENNPSYVVVRDDLRVSDEQYSNPNDVRAISERDFWKKVANKCSDGTVVKIVQYDKNKHQIL